MKLCENILLYAQGELPETDRAAFEAHLKACPSCQAELKFLQKLDEGLSAPAAPQRVVDKLFARTTRKKTLWARFKLAWTAAAVVAVLAGVVAVKIHPAVQPFEAAELVAYVNEDAGDEYTVFAQELTDMEAYF
ncbi:MAG: zf-HC2 domain-containing protein [Elusimicrobiaceae bacterium]|nr:zf-HC2 domain-containing protein [Elusimicrobiaceae bacterium]